MSKTIQQHRMRVWTLLVLSTVSIVACRSREPAEVEVEVRSVGVDRVSHSPVVILQDHHGTKALPIWIGAGEAQSILLQVEGITPPRPLTHDLMKTILEGAGVELQRVLIVDVKDTTYLARIYLQIGRKALEVDSRPSDAIALAVRFHRPIFVATALMKDEAAVDLGGKAAIKGAATVAGVTVQNLTAQLAEYFSLPPGKGVLVAEVHSAASTDLRRGDVILAIDGAAVSGIDDFERKVGAMGRDSAAHLSIQRGSTHLDASLRSAAG